MKAAAQFGDVRSDVASTSEVLMNSPISHEGNAETYVFLALTDNIGVLLHDRTTGATASIDAPDADAVLAALEHTGWTLTDILITHKHADHIDGIPGLRQRFPSVRVTAPLSERDAIGDVDVTVIDGDMVMVGSLRAKVIATPGHTLGHVVYWFEKEKALFAGDTLFALGCGRIFEGNAADMWAALDGLRHLPDDTRIYCGHEYTLANAKFSLTIDPNNKALQERARSIEALRKEGRLTIPSLMSDEKATNPFLRGDDPTIASAVGLTGHMAAEVFAELRERKNHF